jgi:hypothetical protein
MKKGTKNKLIAGILGIVFYIIVEKILNIKVTDWIINLFKDLFR